MPPLCKTHPDPGLFPRASRERQKYTGINGNDPGLLVCRPFHHSAEVSSWIAGIL
jgi:hypothetical protein